MAYLKAIITTWTSFKKIKYKAMLLMQKNSHKHQQLTLLSHACKGLKLRDQCPSLTFVICLCPPADRWFFSNVNLYLHYRRHQRVTGIHLVTAGARASHDLSQFWLKSEKRQVVTLVTGLPFLYICFQL